MLDPTVLMIATQETRRLSESARPGAPTVAAEGPARPRRIGPGVARLLRGLADRVDGRQARLPSRVDA